ncbi:MAG: alginate lyase family protein [Alphaproteobacteria bacterium]|nr:alginate lyase family protein [Alphaproteobacteria bacterium]
MLTPPFDIELARASVQSPYTSKYKCKPIPAPQEDLFFESMYDKKSKNSSIVSPEALKAYQEKTTSIRDLEKGLASISDRYLYSNPPRPEIAACGISWMIFWANHDGFLGQANSMGEFVRKWALASISLSYIQIKDDESLSKKDKEKVRKWIHNMAVHVINDFSDHRERASRQNNHLYWAAWGVMSAAVALDDRDMYKWALDQARFGIFQIQPDGNLPLEIERGPKAYNYHHYAAIPLFLMAETASRNGDDIFGENDNALARLARLILDNMEDQTYFVEKTGKKQNLERTISSSNLAWLEIYYKHSNDPEALRWLEEYRPIKHSRAGGNVTLLYAHIDVRPKKDDQEDEKNSDE